MSLMKHLFGNRKESVQLMDNPPSLDTTTAAGTHVDRDLFIEPEPPVQQAAQRPTRLKELADRDLMEVGRLAGYEHHNMEVCRQMAHRFKAELVRAIDMEMDRLAMNASKLDGELRQLIGEDAMGNVYRKLEAEKERLERARMKLLEQQLLVAGNTGYAELPLTSFSAGFTLGYNAYLQETHLLNQYQG